MLSRVIKGTFNVKLPSATLFGKPESVVSSGEASERVTSITSGNFPWPRNFPPGAFWNAPDFRYRHHGFAK